MSKLDVKYAAFNADSAIGKFSVIVKVEPGYLPKEAYADAGEVVRGELGSGANRVVDGSLRELDMLPDGAWETKSGKGWAWMMKGYLAVNDITLSVVPDASVADGLPSERALIWLGPAHAGLEDYVLHPELVEGWITDQAVVLKDGTMRSTEHFQYGTNGMMLRSALAAGHPESEQGLLSRFARGERFTPIARVTRDVGWALLDRDTPPDYLSGFPELTAALIDPTNMSQNVFKKLQALGESMDRSAAMGQDAVDGFDELHAEVSRLIDASPYQMHPDYGCVANADVARLDAEAIAQSQARKDAEKAIAALSVLENIKMHFEEAASAWASLKVDERNQLLDVDSDNGALGHSIKHGLKAVTDLVDGLLVKATQESVEAPDPE